MSPMGYSKSPITSSSATGNATGSSVSGVSLHTSSAVHTNNVNSGSGSGVGGGGVGMPIPNLAAASSYSCNNPYGLKTVDGNVLNSNNIVGMNSLNSAANVGGVVVGGAVNVGGNNALCSTSMLSTNPNAVSISGAIVGGSGGGGSSSVVNMNVIPGEGPPTPTQELDISGSSSIDPQQRKRK